MTQPPYPPRGMTREKEITVVGPKALRIESYLKRRDGKPDYALVGESLWLLTPTARLALPTPALALDDPFPLDRFAIAPNADFIFGARKVSSGESDLFLWVRQKDKSYKLLPETVNHWVVRRRGKAHRGEEISFVHVVRWTNGGNGVVLATLYRTGVHNYWHLQPIDLVRGRFAPDKIISQNKLVVLI